MCRGSRKENSILEIGDNGLGVGVGSRLREEFR